MPSLVFTLPTTHATIKVNRKIKLDFNTKVIAAPKALKQQGCTIAILLPDISFKEIVFKKVEELGFKVKRTLEIENGS